MTFLNRPVLFSFLVLLLCSSIYIYWAYYDDAILLTLKSFYTPIIVSLAAKISNATENVKEGGSRSEHIPEMIQEPMWYLVPENVEKTDQWYLAATAAFYDYRITKIAILIVSDAATRILEDEGKNNTPPTFHCIYFFNNSTRRIAVKGKFYTSYIFYCPLVRFKSFKKVTETMIRIPETVSLMRNNDTVNWTLPVINLQERLLNRYLNNEHKDNVKKLAICVGILFGYQQWLTVLQFIEFHRLNGVEKFFFFYYEIHESIREIFNWYFANVPGLIEIIHWDPPHFVCNENYRCQLTRDNYCSYMLMHKYKYVGNCDFDELFFPANVGNTTLLDLLHDIDMEDRGSFIFNARYHQLLKNDMPEWVNITGDNVFDSVRTYVPLHHFQNVSTLTGSAYAPKTITKPERVIKRWVHEVFLHVRGAWDYRPTENEAFMRHFKIRSWWGDGANNADKEVTYHMVDPMVEIGESILGNVTRSISNIVMQCKQISESINNKSTTVIITLKNSP